jgi:hypothetical protein
MAFPWTKKTETKVTFITPDQFDNYSKQGYVIMMTKPTAFGTYKAVKIEVVPNYSNDKLSNIKN